MKKPFEIPKTIDSALKLILTVGLLGWNIIEGAIYEHKYPLVMIYLYPLAIWRIALVVLIILASDWCPSVTLLLAFFVFFYIMDLEVTIEKWSLTDLKKNSPNAK